MKFFLGIICILLIGFFTQAYLPWWGIAGIALLTGIALGEKGRPSFWYGFIAVFLLWGGMAFYLSNGNDGILAEKIGALLGGIPGIAVILITGFLGGLVGGLAALTGSLGRAWVQ